MSAPRRGLSALTAAAQTTDQQRASCMDPHKACTKRKLLSLVGVLYHAASVICLGRPFVRCLIEQSKKVKHLHVNFIVRLDVGARSDITWWHSFITQWNGIGFLPLHQCQLQVTTDASGSWGCGAFSGYQWFQLRWSQSTAGSQHRSSRINPNFSVSCSLGRSMAVSTGHLP